MKPLTLDELGWKPFFQQQLEPDSAFLPARVARQNSDRYQLLTELGAVAAVLPGRTRVEVNSRAELPTVGDWVTISPGAGTEDHPVTIQSTLTRLTKFSRKEAGDRVDEQVVAANIDTVFVVTGLDDNFNSNRIERYLLLCWSSGAQPVIVLNKADLCTDLEKSLAKVDRIAAGTPVHVISALNKEGISSLSTYIETGTTVAVLGSSGVGKSTLINLLLGYDHFKTGDVRDTDSKGRHTTTHRELCPIPGGGLIIDTPGMRELQLWSDDANRPGGFEDIRDLIAHCRFNDCQHNSEPGCAVQAALAADELSEDRWRSFDKFNRELQHLAEQQNLNLRIQKKSGRKKFAKMLKERPNKRDE